MYEEFYGFAQPPFSLTPDPHFLYRSESHEAALQQVWQAIRRKEGFIVLAGDTGTGKTTLCRTILDQFEPTTFTALVLNPFLTVEELLRQVLISYGIASRDAPQGSRLATATRNELARTLHDFLMSLAPLGGSAVLIIDEAQHLSPDVLEEIRVLSNLEAKPQQLLHIVLVGQLNLLDTLSTDALRQLNQRISVRCVLQPLTREEVEAYITHRLWVARGSAAVSFSPASVDAVHNISFGVPRVVNLLCDRALMLGAETRSNVITDTMVVNAAQALALTVPGSPGAASSKRGGRRVWAAAAVVLALLAAVTTAAVLGWGNPLELAEAAANPPVSPPPANGYALRAVSVPVIPDPPLRLTSPSPAEGTFAVMIGTYTVAHEAAKAEAALRARSLPLYALDMRFSTGIRRRLFVGRYPTRERAEEVRSQLAAAFPAARVVTASSELWDWD
jgi:general secretion pathway protein A